MYDKAEFTIGWKTWVVIIVVSLCMWAGIVGIVRLLSHSADNATLYSTTIYGADVEVPVECQFDPPLKHITLIMHWYDDYQELNFDYQTLVKQDGDPEEIWGWSNCIWQPDDNWAACDIYTVVPEFVHADLAMDTLGHEVLHGACGDFHD